MTTKTLELIETVDLPEYAVCAIEYGDYSGLNDEDTENVELFLAGYSEYHSLTFEYAEEGNFNSWPVFGLACNTLETKVYGIEK